MILLLILFTVSNIVLWTEAFPNGAPSESCLRQYIPHHGLNKPQDPHNVPFAIYRRTTPGRITVTIEDAGGLHFMGFLVQARKRETGIHAAMLGHWQPIANVKVLDECAAVTHADKMAKNSVTLTWLGYEDVDIIVAIVVQYDVFWVELEAPEIEGATVEFPANRHAETGLEVHSDGGVTSHHTTNHHSEVLPLAVKHAPAGVHHVLPLDNIHNHEGDHRSHHDHHHHSQRHHNIIKPNNFHEQHTELHGHEKYGLPRSNIGLDEIKFKRRMMINIGD